MKLVDVSFHGSHFGHAPEQYLKKATPNIGYAKFLKNHHKPTFVFHGSGKAIISKDGVQYIFRKKRVNSKLLLPLSLYFKIRKMKPEVILVHSIIYIHFTAFLRLFLPSKTKIFIQNHAEKVPRSGFKRAVVRFLDPMIDGYFFTASDLARPWVTKGLISSMAKVHEVMEGSTLFQTREKHRSRATLGLPEQRTFIWVGRLDGNKDPMCAIKAFHAHADKGHRFALYMFYHTRELLGEMESYIAANGLEDYIILKGQIAHKDLELWYNASDFFISASHSEGSGYALCEAMACSCIPIVTDIPSFRYITDNGRSGFLFPPGDWGALSGILEQTETVDLKVFQNKVAKTFTDKLSFEAIGRTMDQVFTSKK